MYNISALTKLLLIILQSFITIPMIALVSKFNLYKTQTTLVQIWFNINRVILGLKVTKTGDIPTDKALIITSNHCSYIDIIIIGSIIKCHFTPKIDIKSWPIIGFITNLNQPVYINRGNKKSISSETKKIEQYLSQKRNIVIFPEGTTSNGTTVLPFKSSLFSITENMTSHNGYIIPLCIIYNKCNNVTLNKNSKESPIAWYGDDTLVNHLWKILKIPRTEVTIKFLPSINPENKSRKEIAKECEESVRENFMKNIHT